MKYPFILLTILLISCSTETNENTTMERNDQSLNEKIQLHEFSRYNQWANEAFFDWLITLPDSIRERETGSSFPTIKATLIHLWGAEHGWLCALKQEEWTRPFSGDEYSGSFEELVESFRRTTRVFTDYVIDLDMEQLQSPIPRSNNQFYSAEDIILHVINHATYHRGQIVTMARSLGATNPPRTDFIYYKSHRN